MQDDLVVTLLPYTGKDMSLHPAFAQFICPVTFVHMHVTATQKTWQLTQSQGKKLGQGITNFFIAMLTNSYVLIQCAMKQYVI